MHLLVQVEKGYMSITICSVNTSMHDGQESGRKKAINMRGIFTSRRDALSLLSLLTVQATGNKWGKGKAKNTHQEVLSQS